MRQLFDVAIIGAGVVGCAIARELSRYQLKVALIEANSDVGMGTSKASTAIWHTGYDAKPGSLEAKLLKRSYKLMDKYLQEANIAHERIGGLLIAWNQEQFEALPLLLKQARENGHMDVQLISPEEIYRREPHINVGAMGGLFVPGEGVLCTFSIPLAFAYQAVLNDVDLFLNFQVKEIHTSTTDNGPVWSIINGLSSTDDEIQARYVVNAAGLYSDEINAHFGKNSFKVTPRRGQLIIYDKMARRLVNHVLLPVPTSKTKGVLISPTVYGNILLGPTAEDLPDKTATETTADGLQMLIGKGHEILPLLVEEEITATYSGLRAATEHSDYQIEVDAAFHYLCLGGIRSTGISGAMGIAEYGVELLQEAGLILSLKDEFKLVKMPTIGEADIRPHQSAERIAQNASYAEMVCHCERVSRGELIDAMKATIPATSLDALRRRTRASQGRCQGFNCHAALTKMLVSDPVHHPKQTEPILRVQAKDISENALLRRRKANIIVEPDVLIVGAGPAGLSAAIELKKLGIENILIVDREPEAGGMPRFCHHTGFGREDLWRMLSGPQYASYYRELARKMQVDIKTSTTVMGWGSSDIHSLKFTSPKGLGEIKARTVLLATGVRERPRSARLVPGTRPQGIYTTGSLQRFTYQEKLPVGKTAVIVGAELVSLSVLMTLMHSGVKCEMMVTEEPVHQIEFPYIVMKWALADFITRTPIIKNSKISEIFGKKRVEGVEILGKNGQKRYVECDTLIFTGSWIPEHELARLGGLAINPLTRGPKIDAEFQSTVDGVFAAGNLLRGVETADHCAVEGRRAAKSIHKFLKVAK